MTMLLRRWFRVVVATVMLGFTVPAIITLIAADTRPIAAKAREWAASNRDKLPTTLEALAPYPQEYRRQAFFKMSPEQKSSLWRTQITQVLKTRQLSQAQRAVLERAIKVFSPEVYRPGANLSEASQLCKDFGAVFPQEDRALLSTIGLDQAPTESTVVKVARIAQQFLGTATVSAFDLCCDCSTGSFCACPFSGKYCSPWQDSGCVLPGIGDCQPMTCGCGLVWPCDGLCRGNQGGGL